MDALNINIIKEPRGFIRVLQFVSQSFIGYCYIVLTCSFSFRYSRSVRLPRLRTLAPILASMSSVMAPVKESLMKSLTHSSKNNKCQILDQSLIDIFLNQARSWKRSCLRKVYQFLWWFCIGFPVFCGCRCPGHALFTGIASFLCP